MGLKEFGQHIRMARRTQGISQGDLATRLRMSRATISAIENGTVSEIGIRKYMALCGALGLRIRLEENRRPTLSELQKELSDEKAQRKTQRRRAVLHP